MTVADLPRIPLIRTPTPLHRLARMSDLLGIDLWVKRDDLTGFALGGNKGRKLEYLLAEAVADNAEAVVSCGAAQSNFVRQLGAACSALGLRCVAVVMSLPYDNAFGQPHGWRLEDEGGNVFLDSLLGVNLRRIPDGPWETLFAETEAVAQELEGQGLRVYRVPIGGSSPVGAYGFVQAARELLTQDAAFDTIVVASSSGSTQAGLAHGLAEAGIPLVGVSCDPEPDLLDTLVGLCAGLDDLTGRRVGLSQVDLDVRFGWVGPGYGVPSEGSLDAIRLMARTEGIFLDPIYSGKALAGLIDLAARGELQGRTLFWHTGGTPTVFATPQLRG